LEEALPRRPRYGAPAREALAFAVFFALAYGALAVILHREAPRLFLSLDQAFDADLGSWTIDIARPQGPHQRTRFHPISVLLLNPAGSALRFALRADRVDTSARLAAALLCALAGGTAVGVFRLLLDRLGVPASRAPLWTLVFALSASLIFFSSVPESYVFSALSLVTVFAVAAGPAPSERWRTAAGAVSFGITVTNLGAVALARASGLDRRRLGRAAVTLARHLALVLGIVAALALVQRALYPTAELWFVPAPLSGGYTRSFEFPTAWGDAAVRGAALASHLAFACLAAPRVSVLEGPPPSVDFPAVPLRALRPAGAAHAAGWGVLLAIAAAGLWGRVRARPVLAALLAWLAFEALLHLALGESLFLYSGHWTFALVALVAAGVGSRGGPAITALLGTVVVLQLAANAGLLSDLFRIFGATAG
jgi:hypothetical protein